MVDRSWGGPPTGNLRVPSNLTPGDRAAERAAAREVRVQERASMAGRRLEERAATREADARQREDARAERREQEGQATTGEPHADAARRHRRSGRKDVVREQRDTRGYVTVVDASRMRELARRGASIGGLAAAFGVTVEEVAAALAADAPS